MTTENQRNSITIGQIRRRALLTSLIASIICLIVFGGIGYLLDLTLDKKPIFFIIGIVLAFISTNLLVIYLGSRFAKKNKLTN